jgi:hypothetical protein
LEHAARSSQAAIRSRSLSVFPVDLLDKLLVTLCVEGQGAEPADLGRQVQPLPVLVDLEREVDVNDHAAPSA